MTLELFFCHTMHTQPAQQCNNNRLFVNFSKLSQTFATSELFFCHRMHKRPAQQYNNNRLCANFSKSLQTLANFCKPLRPWNYSFAIQYTHDQRNNAIIIDCSQTSANFRKPYQTFANLCNLRIILLRSNAHTTSATMQ